MNRLFVLASVSLLLGSVLASRASNLAERILSYSPGIGFATEFSTGIGYTNALAALGEPSRITPGEFGGPVDPFSPPYLSSQLVSLGAGGTLTLAMSAPILNREGEAFGLDFIIFGASGFVITNGNFTGGGVTDGSLFGASTGGSRVAVSTDNVSWYELDPALTPRVDGLYPTDGLGQFGWPVNPSYDRTVFQGQDLVGLRRLYAGSGGGTGFDLSWARNAAGERVALPSAQYIRIDVLSDRVEIDAIAAVPEPTAAGLILMGLTAWLGRAYSLRRKQAVAVHHA